MEWPEGGADEAEALQAGDRRDGADAARHGPHGEGNARPAPRADGRTRGQRRVVAHTGRSARATLGAVPSLRGAASARGVRAAAACTVACASIAACTAGPGGVVGQAPAGDALAARAGSALDLVDRGALAGRWLAEARAADGRVGAHRRRSADAGAGLAGVELGTRVAEPNRAEAFR